MAGRDAISVRPPGPLTTVERIPGQGNDMGKRTKSTAGETALALGIFGTLVLAPVYLIAHLVIGVFR